MRLDFKVPTVDKKGFTLIEAIVATAVFAFVVSSIIGVYLSTIQLDRKTRAQRAVTQTARFIAEFMTKEVRNGTIDYSGANSCVNSATTLCLINQGGEIEKIVVSGTDLILTKNSQSTNLNPAAAKVTSATFYTLPIGDPFTSSRTYNQQPSVTLALELTSNYASGPGKAIKLNLQTTFTTRTYPARVVAVAPAPSPAPAPAPTPPPPPAPTCSGCLGGAPTRDGNFLVYTFVSTSCGCSFTTTSSFSVQYLIVAGGGGGGGGDTPGGGGAGGMLTSSDTLSSGTFPISVGGGGAGSASAFYPGNNGGNSSFNGHTAAGGGGGGSPDAWTTGRGEGAAGGSGGGGAWFPAFAPGGIGSQGHNGGQGNQGAGGGGGQGATGLNGIPGYIGGDGGAGSPSTIRNGSSVYYAGGGGGGGGPIGNGGTGGGGGAAHINGDDNTGGGGGGTATGGNGGSGIVILRVFSLP